MQRSPSPSPHKTSSSPRHRTSPDLPRPRTRARPRPCPKPIEITFHRCSSEPLLRGSDEVPEGCNSHLQSGGQRCFSRQYTFNDVFSSYPPAPELCFSPLPRDNPFVGYEKDTKILITVTVEGSPGPIKTVVKLGTSVDDAIKIVIQKYVQEGRTPRLDKNASSAFDLHLSYFSFQCLDRSDIIGETGSRSFYLKRVSRKGDSVGSEAASSADDGSRPPSMVVLPWFITHKFSKIVRRMRKLFKVFGCLQCR